MIKLCLKRFGGTKTMDGTYKLKLSTQMGEQNGILSLVTSKDSFTGSLEMMGMKQDISGIINGNNFEFKLEARKMLMKVKVVFHGTITGDQLTGEADTNFGKISVSGDRIN